MLNESKKQVLFSEFTPGFGISLALEKSKKDIIDIVIESKLRGRGGAGFPTGYKWKSSANAKKTPKYVVCNADEGEPGTFKDRILLSEHPEKLFEGMAICGYAIGSNHGIVYLRGEYRYLLKPLLKVLERLRKTHYLGKNILNSNFEFDIEIYLGSGAYICGEETALIESLEGQRGEARNKPPFPTEEGYLGKPTVVNNVETFSYIPYIINKGAEWFKEMGTEKSKGSKLFSISGDVKYPGVYELPMGSTVKEILELVGARDTKAVQVGGASGVCISKKEFDKPLAFESLPPGGSIIVFDQSRDILKVLKNFMEFFVEESCGQCTPCREGNFRLLEAVEKLERGECSINYLKTLRDLAETMKFTSKCGLGQTSPNAFLSIINNFKGEILARPKKPAENNSKAG